VGDQDQSVESKLYEQEGFINKLFFSLVCLIRKEC